MKCACVIRQAVRVARIDAPTKQRLRPRGRRAHRVHARRLILGVAASAGFNRAMFEKHQPRHA